MPDDWTTYIKDVKLFAKDLDKLGTDYWSLWQHFKNHNIYFLAVSQDDTSKLIQTKYMGTEAGFLSDMNDDPADISKEKVVQLLEHYQNSNLNNTYTGWDLYTSFNQRDYIIFEYWYDSDGRRIYCQQYLTTYDEQCLALTLQSSGKEITPANGAVQKVLVESMQYPDSLIHPPQPGQTLADTSSSDASPFDISDNITKPDMTESAMITPALRSDSVNEMNCSFWQRYAAYYLGGNII